MHRPPPSAQPDRNERGVGSRTRVAQRLGPQSKRQIGHQPTVSPACASNSAAAASPTSPSFTARLLIVVGGCRRGLVELLEEQQAGDIHEVVLGDDADELAIHHDR